MDRYEIAVRLKEAHDIIERLLGGRYHETIDPLAAMLRQISEKRGVPVLSVGLSVCQGMQAEGRDVSYMLAALYDAAVSEGTAKQVERLVTP